MSLITYLTLTYPRVEVDCVHLRSGNFIEGGELHLTAIPDLKLIVLEQLLDTSLRRRWIFTTDWIVGIEEVVSDGDIS